MGSLQTWPVYLDAAIRSIDPREDRDPKYDRDGNRYTEPFRQLVVHAKLTRPTPVAGEEPAANGGAARELVWLMVTGFDFSPMATLLEIGNEQVVPAPHCTSTDLEAFSAIANDYGNLKLRTIPDLSTGDSPPGNVGTSRANQPHRMLRPAYRPLGPGIEKVARFLAKRLNAARPNR
ncbi:hypothetical protein [Sciscionella marina]|uniref:hypothetical protein n=1 Tax=Sciscionella marina TaxID=508770 RepID=UPI00036364AB|nr:hypothetical protein [Sciscionella marina]